MVEQQQPREQVQTAQAVEWLCTAGVLIEHQRHQQLQLLQMRQLADALYSVALDVELLQRTVVREGLQTLEGVPRHIEDSQALEVGEAVQLCELVALEVQLLESKAVEAVDDSDVVI